MRGLFLCPKKMVLIFISLVISMLYFLGIKLARRLNNYGIKIY